MSKKYSEVSVAQLPTPPRVEQFVRLLQECKDRKEGNKEPINSNMFEDDSDHDDQIRKPKNTKRTAREGMMPQSMLVCSLEH